MLDAEFLSIKKIKHQFIAELLDSKYSYEQRNNTYDFVVRDPTSANPRISATNTSTNPYSKAILDEIANPANLILDCGCGYKTINFKNVVFLDMLEFDNVDVISDCEVLPFKDGVFDCVISQTVLEHVKNPFRGASEIKRVLKQGGRVFCEVPFLQPVHNYPAHYFNMTHQALAHLFEDGMEITEQFIDRSGEPLWFLNWFLNIWLQGLDDQDGREFKSLRIGDLAESVDKFWDNDFVKNLNREHKQQIACTNTLIAIKK